MEIELVYYLFISLSTFLQCLLLLSQIAGTQEKFCCHFVHSIVFNQSYRFLQMGKE